MERNATYFIWWTAEIVDGPIVWSADCEVEVEVTFDAGGDIDHWYAVEIHGTNRSGRRALCNSWPGTKVRGVLDRLNAAKSDEYQVMDRRVCEVVAEDPEAPRPRDDAAEHGTLYQGGAL